MVEVTNTLRKIGGSLVIAIAPEIINVLNLKEGMTLIEDISFNGDIIIKKVNKNG